MSKREPSSYGFTTQQLVAGLWQCIANLACIGGVAWVIYITATRVSS